MDYEQLSRELTRALRGQRSQLAVARRLGFSSNVLYAWENGRRFPVASEFFRLAKLHDKQVVRALGAVLDLPVLDLALTKPEGVAELLRALARDRTTSALARGVGADRTTVARWLHGASEPRLPDLLRIVELTTLRLLDVVAIFADPERLPSTARAYANLKAQRKLAYEIPWSHAVLRALELRGYSERRKHDAAYIAERLGLDEATVEALLASLAAAGQIRSRDGRYELAEVMVVDTRAEKAANLRLKQHWARLALERFSANGGSGSGFLSYNLCAVSARGYERIRELHIEYYERIRDVVAQDGKPERVALVNLQLLALDEVATEGQPLPGRATKRAKA